MPYPSACISLIMQSCLVWQQRNSENSESEKRLSPLDQKLVMTTASFSTGPGSDIAVDTIVMDGFREEIMESNALILANISSLENSPSSV